MRTPRHSRLTQVVVPALIMVGVAVAAIVASMHSGFDAAHPPTTAPAMTTTPTPVPTPAPVTIPTPIADSLHATTDSTTSATTTPTTVTTANAATAKVEEIYSVAVGTYLFKDRAQTKAKRIARRTMWDARVESTDADGSRAYRILVGRFTSEAEAEKAADRMLTRGLVSEALVEKQPTPRKRH